jgi:hypothetical protein
VSLPLRSRIKNLPKPAATIGTFSDLFLGPVHNEGYPAKGKAEYDQQDKNHPAGFRHFLFYDGHSFMIAKGAFKSHGFHFIGLPIGYLKVENYSYIPLSLPP